MIKVDIFQDAHTSQKFYIQKRISYATKYEKCPCGLVYIGK